MRLVLHTLAAFALAIPAACTSEEDKEKACYEKLAADFEASRLFGREQSDAALRQFLTDDAVAWSQYALTAAESALSISAIYTDDDRNACDYVSAGANLERK